MLDTFELAAELLQENEIPTELHSFVVDEFAALQDDLEDRCESGASIDSHSAGILCERIVVVFIIFIIGEAVFDGVFVVHVLFVVYDDTDFFGEIEPMGFFIVILVIIAQHIYFLLAILAVVAVVLDGANISFEGFFFIFMNEVIEILVV